MSQGVFWTKMDKPCARHIAAVNTQGAQAVASGKAAEDLIYCILQQRGYDVQRQVTLERNIFGHQSRVDFVVHGIPHFSNGLIIESKWQERPGTADEKFSFLVDNIKQCYPHPTIVIVAGGGAREGAVNWLRTQADGAQLYAVFSMEEFLTWTIRNL